MSTPTVQRRVNPNFITEIIDEDLKAGRYSQIVTRFPPEPNGYAHLGHAIASYLNWGIAQDYGGLFRLRMDDTNPQTERQEYAEALVRDLAWLGLRWDGKVEYASDYFEDLYQMALRLIQKGLAYVDSIPHEEMVRLRGSVEVPGTPSPYRQRSIEENLELFQRMRAGEFPTGAHVLRAKIDLASPNMKLRDPVLYRIVHAEHYRTGTTWPIYPSYDFAQAPTDALIGVTHSLCSLEFVDNRAIYDWLMEHLWGEPRPRQYEFGRRSLEYTVVSKRKLLKLIAGGHVTGWDDPRMPTLAGQRRRGVTPEALRTFAKSVGISRTNRTVDIALLEHAIREDLNLRAPRVMAVIRPLKVVLTNLEAESTLSLRYWPDDVVRGSPDGLVARPNGERVRPEEAVRPVPLTPELYIEADDFEVEPPPGFKRLTPGGTVRLRGAGLIRCDEYLRDATGQVCELRCTWLGEAGKASGVIHWVSATQSLRAEFRLYDRLFRVPLPESEAKELEEEEEGETREDRDFLSFLNPQSLEVRQGWVEASVASDPPETRYQFERLGYFWPDPLDSKPGALVFNRIVGLRDSWKGAEGPRPKGEPRAPKEEKGQGPGQVVLSAQEQARFERFKGQGVGEADARVLARDPALEAYLNQAARWAPVAHLASWVVNELGSSIREGSNKVSPAALAELVALVQGGEINTRIAKDVLAEAQSSGENPAEIVRARGLRQVNDSAALEAVLDRILAAHPDQVAAYRGGKTGLLGFFVGQVMRETGGQANPQTVRELVLRRLG
ncbi:glutamine--tRNA ligase/YqeY domain fusion protein [Meiothermus granaticius]|uniref:Glutamine--tRNA ligase n=1 Tax=Meiothermus granaticius NBRC 107808 TaxID=1227551 RepID=A0A399F847_9DEIN|nr:glutamine--tRNA ligase/YqeY domain fusion protein [Meiothermus granaticius]RIH92837.1 Glutamine--tRNA ligase [Meiothermus granaticius NBRC 107808]GEM85551.1 glutamine--tRNA ligase [Meiothermus granaticius NBRC 107808]